MSKRIKKVNSIVEGKFISLYDLEYVNKLNQDKHWSVVTRKNKEDIHEIYLNGKEDKVDAVAIIAYHVEYNKLVVIKQFRVPVNDYIYEVPAGLVDKGETDVIETVRRELKEETGLNLLDINEKYSKSKTYLSPGMTDESVALIFCTCNGEISEDYLEANEDIKTILVSQEEAKAILESDEKIDIKAFLMLQNFVLLGDKMFV
ncbi:MAG: NUDIX hydrolase [Intestinibacter sp.]|uniref:NUDIX hydrolase n=1 Tax=Intestinibacter sp. TaxID=1965304 RepID=UPI003F14A9AE